MRKTKRDGDQRGGGRGYHHGNLSEALVQAALDLIAKYGPAGFSFAEVTRAVGVSPAAPYRHFRDRDALMADIARRGFDRFAIALSQAWQNGQPDPLTALKAVGQAYLAFARDEPAYFAAMFEARTPTGSSRELVQATERAFDVLRQACEALIAELPNGKRPPVLMMSLHVWAMAHGIAALFGRGDGARRNVPMTPEDLLEANMLIYLDGLGLGELKT
ncbi:MAG: TetR/AcrR family transcriptional regulator [Proteobacteria bacterium]|nr:TetR/AcrR family transcriptional regulator [Pseudomonadota bacterium]